jgi:hypothetical protein
MHSPVVQMKDRHAARQGESLLSTVTRIQKQPAPDALLEWFVRMPENDRVRIRRRNSPLHRFRKFPDIHDVMQQEAKSPEFDNLRLPERKRTIRIPENRGDRGDLLQLNDDCVLADIAAVQNVLHAGEKIGNFWIEKIMRIGKNADFHLSLTSARYPLK